MTEHAVTRELSGATVAIVGVGLLGGSLGLALAGRCSRRIGVVAGGEERAARDALLLGAVDEIAALEQAVGAADIVVLAAPVGQILELVPRVAALARPGTLVTDVGSTKRAIVAAMRAAGSDVVFVGGHPMCGGTTPGVANAHGSLFADATWVICPVEGDPGDGPTRLAALVDAVGAHVLELDADAHDRAAALVSHLPYVLARTLVRRLREQPEAAPLAAAGWRHSTRHADGDEVMWRDVLDTNAGYVADEIDALRDALADVAAWLRGRPT